MNHNCNIGISSQHRKAVIEILNNLLADEYLLYTKTLQFHWNVQGKHFDPLHAFFKKQYEELFDIVDAIAERARTLNGIALGSLTEFLKHTRLKEHHSTHMAHEQEMIALLLQDHEAIIRIMRTDIEACLDKFHDVGTNNFLTEILEKHEKIAWMLRSSLESTQ